MDTEDLPDFLGGEPTPDAAPAAEAIAATPEPTAEAAPAAEAPAAEPEAQAEGQPRGPDGKFAAATPAEAAPAVQAEPQAAASAPQPEVIHHVPLATFLDTRDKLTAAEKEAKELRAWRDQQEAAARRQPIPSREEDPAGYEQHREAQFQEHLRQQGLMTSRRLAEMEHGKETVAKAYDWGFARCETDPHFNAKLMGSLDPVALVVSEWKQAQTAEKFGSVDPAEFESFQQWKAAQQAAAPAQGSQPPAQPHPAAQPAAPAAPRPSLAAGPSAGRADAAEVGDVEDTYEQMFRR